jgi:hypothetical protein
MDYDLSKLSNYREQSNDKDIYIDLPSITKPYDDNNYLDIYNQQEQPFFVNDSDYENESNEDEDEDEDELYPPNIIINGPSSPQEVSQQSQQIYPPNIIIKEQPNYNKYNKMLTHFQKEKYMSKPIETHDVGTRDNIFQTVQEQIDLKRQYLANKQSELKEYISTNDFLRSVKDDYGKYNDFIMNEKKQQIKALDTLKQYSEDLRINGQLTEERIKDTMKDQEYILNEMGYLKKQLDEYTCPNK